VCVHGETKKLDLYRGALPPPFIVQGETKVQQLEEEGIGCPSSMCIAPRFRVAGRGRTMVRPRPCLRRQGSSILGREVFSWA
jgi:hypothetical protein